MPGRIRLVKYEIRLGMKYWSNWVEIPRDDIQFHWSNLTGHKLLVNWVEIH